MRFEQADYFPGIKGLWQKRRRYAVKFPNVLARRNYNPQRGKQTYHKYPPYGARGCGPKGAVSYGLESEKEYYGSGHLKMCRFVQIEQKSAAEDAENIAKLPYLDGCVLGMHDLSGSIGRLGDIFCEENLRLVNKEINAFKAQNKTVAVSTFATDAETLSRYKAMGINMISTEADYEYIIKGAQSTLKTVKDKVKFL